MIWHSMSDFFAMGGYALYVWGSFFVVFGCMGGEILLLKQRGKSIHRQLGNVRTSHPSRLGGINESKA